MLNGKKVSWITPYILDQENEYESDSIYNDLAILYNQKFNKNNTLLWNFGIKNQISKFISGIYQCIAINSYGTALSSSLNLTIASKGICK